MDQINSSSANPWRGRLALLGIVLFFVTPLLVVFAMKWVNFQPGGKSHGVLIQPPRTLVVNAAWKLPGQSNKTNLSNTVWNERWNIVITAKQCETVCMHDLYLVRQVHMSLAKEIDRVQRVLITTQDSVDNIQKKYPDLVVINKPLQEAQNTLLQFGLNKNKPQEGIYLVDPLGNLVMYYPVNVEGKALRSDVLKLLKFSWAG